MSLFEKLNALSKKISDMKNQARNEQDTKTALILPFFTCLGYDIHDLNEFSSEVTADFGKGGNRVDYVVKQGGKPVILVECKSVSENLNDSYKKQLSNYYNNSDAKFAILTNGVQYFFFTDVQKTNIMGEQEFFKFDMLNICADTSNVIENFVRGFNIKNAYDKACELQYEKIADKNLDQLLKNPSNEFVKMLLQTYSKPTLAMQTAVKKSIAKLGETTPETTYKPTAKFSVGETKAFELIYDIVAKHRKSTDYWCRKYAQKKCTSVWYRNYKLCDIMRKDGVVTALKFSGRVVEENNEAAEFQLKTPENVLDYSNKILRVMSLIDDNDYIATAKYSENETKAIDTIFDIITKNRKSVDYWCMKYDRQFSIDIWYRNYKLCMIMRDNGNVTSLKFGGKFIGKNNETADLPLKVPENVLDYADKILKVMNYIDNDIEGQK